MEFGVLESRAKKSCVRKGLLRPGLAENLIVSRRKMHKRDTRNEKCKRNHGPQKQ
jgi:hypothetical protein